METLQNILVVFAAIGALWMLYGKFFKKQRKSKSCGNDDCGC